MNRLPAGLIDENVELFSVGEFALAAIYGGQVVPFACLPGELLAQLEAFFLSFGADFGGNLCELERACWCAFGGFDSRADVDVQTGAIRREYWDCGKRKSCLLYTKWCLASPPTPSGLPLGEREMQFVMLYARGMAHAEIAEKMGVAKGTVVAMYNRVREKLTPDGRGYEEVPRGEILRWAVEWLSIEN